MDNRKTNIGEKLYGSKTVKKITKKVNLLGVQNTYDPINLLNIRFLSSLSIFFMLLYFVDFGYLVAPLITFIYYLTFFTIVLDSKINKRCKELEKDAMYFFEILVLSLEAGRGIKTSIELTTSSVDSLLSDEFRKVLKDIDLGKNLNDALNDLKYRIPSDTINNIILNIRQSNIFGNNIVDTVYAQLDYIREKRILEAKAQISKIPVKISIISVIFFIPLILLLLLGPALINFIS